MEFHFKFSPLSSNYEISQKSMFHFYIEIVAIVGSLLVFFEFLTEFMNSVFWSQLGLE